MNDNVISTEAYLAKVRSIRPSQAGRRNISDFNRSWVDPVLERLEYLVRLEHGWDGYNAPNVSFSTAAFAFSMLDSICGPNTATPSLVPGINGDIQIEWHTLRGDIELHVRAPNDVVAWRSTPAPDGEEVLLKNNFSVIAEWVAELMEPPFAANAAA